MNPTTAICVCLYGIAFCATSFGVFGLCSAWAKINAPDDDDGDDEDDGGGGDPTDPFGADPQQDPCDWWKHPRLEKDRR